MASETRLRELAYQIWAAERKPSGAAKRHWQLACELAETELEGYIQPVTKLSPLEPLEQLEPEDP